MMSTKIALVLLICVVLGLANADTLRRQGDINGYAPNREARTTDQGLGSPDPPVLPTFNAVDPMNSTCGFTHRDYMRRH